MVIVLLMVIVMVDSVSDDYCEWNAQCCALVRCRLPSIRIVWWWVKRWWWYWWWWHGELIFHFLVGTGERCRWSAPHQIGIQRKSEAVFGDDCRATGLLSFQIEVLCQQTCMPLVIHHSLLITCHSSLIPSLITHHSSPTHRDYPLLTSVTHRSIVTIYHHSSFITSHHITSLGHPTNHNILSRPFIITVVNNICRAWVFLMWREKSRSKRSRYRPKHNHNPKNTHCNSSSSKMSAIWP